MSLIYDLPFHPNLKVRSANLTNRLQARTNLNKHYPDFLTANGSCFSQSYYHFKVNACIKQKTII